MPNKTEFVNYKHACVCVCGVRKYTHRFLGAFSKSDLPFCGAIFFWVINHHLIWRFQEKMSSEQDSSSKRAKGADGTFSSTSSSSTITTHVVLFRMKDSFTAKVEAEAVEALKNFPGNIPGVLSATFGRTFTTEHSKDFTHCLVVTMDHPSRLKTYGPSEEHQKWAQTYTNPNFSDVLKVDIDAPIHQAKI